jgi:hypothetical protein
MRAATLSWTPQGRGWNLSPSVTGAEDVVFYFGARQRLREHGDWLPKLRAIFGSAHLVGCSTGGQISGNEILDDGIAALALSFEDTGLRLAREAVSDATGSRRCGEDLGRSLAAPDLAGIFVLSDGLHVNGSALIAGIASAVGERIPITGGLAGDGPDFRETVVGADMAPCSKIVAAIGFYGSSLRIGHGSEGGWGPFGPRRMVTRSSGNVLFELDGEPALDLYERYLGDEAAGLPSTALLFPLRVYDPGRPDHDIVRTILAIDRQARSMTFAGDVPEGWVAQLMRGHFARLASGAASAAIQAREACGDTNGDKAAVLVSCIGRRLLMGQHCVDEIEAVGGELGTQTKRVGFYSYGEISPHAASGVCELHNQTMTITVFREEAA